MTLAKLIPRNYHFVEVDAECVNADRMLTDAESDTYAEIRPLAAPAVAILHLCDFDFSMVPDEAVVDTFTIYLTGTGYRLSESNAEVLLAIYIAEREWHRIPETTSSGQIVIAGETEDEARQPKTITIPTSILTWDELKAFGPSLCIEVPMLFYNSGGFMHIYGAEIDVEYTTPEPGPEPEPEPAPVKVVGVLTGTLTALGNLTGILSASSTPPIMYDGPYEFTPSNEIQTVGCEGLTMSSNITINPIPQNYGLITYNGSSLKVS